MKQLVQYHDELAALMGKLATETARTKPDMAALTQLRMRLTQVSRKRAAFVDTSVQRLKPTVSGDAARQLDDLIQSIQRARVASAAHIGRWTPAAIEADWTGYRDASATLRVAMRDHIRKEVAVLGPLLSASPTVSQIG